MPPITELVLASKNRHKLEEMQAILKDFEIRVRSLAEFPDVQEVDETGDTFQENARQKAIGYALATGLPALADDSGLCVAALGGRPGIHSARYAGGAQVDHAANNQKLLEELAPHKNRAAQFVCFLCLADAGGPLLEAEGSVEGEILTDRRGQQGFGYDPLFYYPPLKKTLAELSADEKNQVSHRARALAAFRQKIIGW